jgi:hypothetical protein
VGRLTLTKGLGISLVAIEMDGILELGNTRERAAPDPLLRNLRGESLNQIEPSRTGRRELHMEAAMLGRPTNPRRMFLRATIRKKNRKEHRYWSIVENRRRRYPAPGAHWLALKLWEELQLGGFWGKWLTPSRKGTRWEQVLFILVAYRLLSPGVEWRQYRLWYERSALGDLLGGSDSGIVDIQAL